MGTLSGSITVAQENIEFDCKCLESKFCQGEQYSTIGGSLSATVALKAGIDLKMDTPFVSVSIKPCGIELIEVQIGASLQGGLYRYPWNDCEPQGCVEVGFNPVQFSGMVSAYGFCVGYSFQYPEPVNASNWRKQYCF